MISILAVLSLISVVSVGLYLLVNNFRATANIDVITPELREAATRELALLERETVKLIGTMAVAGIAATAALAQFKALGELIAALSIGLLTCSLLACAGAFTQQRSQLLKTSQGIAPPKRRNWFVDIACIFFGFGLTSLSVGVSARLYGGSPKAWHRLVEFMTL